MSQEQETIKSKVGKTCEQCKEFKEFNLFFKRKGADDGYSKRCQKCEKEKGFALRENEFF